MKDFLELMHRLGILVLLGAGGLTVLAIIRGVMSPWAGIERVILGLVVLHFGESWFEGLQEFSIGLSGAVAFAFSHHDLRETLTRLLNNGQKALANSPIADLVRIGVWGVMRAIVEGVFLIASYVLESAQGVIWKLIACFFPIAAGLFPIAPRHFQNLSVFALEVSCWIPMMLLIEGIAAEMVDPVLAAHEAGSLGLEVVAIELVAVLLIYNIPKVTHQIFSGLASADFGLHQASLGITERVIQAVAKSPIQSGEENKGRYPS